MYILARSFPSFETPVGVQLPALNVMSLIVIYTKEITLTFKNKLSNKKKQTALTNKKHWNKGNV